MRASGRAPAPAPAKLLILACAVLPSACGTFRTLRAPAVPHDAAVMPRAGQVPDSLLARLLDESGLVVLGTPVDRISEEGVFTPWMQMGNKQTWYSVRLAVDSVAKGNLRQAKTVDLGFAPLNIVSNQRFARLAEHEIVVQSPETQSPRGSWGDAPPVTVGERAVYLFRKCYYCVELGGVPTRGPYYKANPWVAMTWASKLPPEDWPRVVRLLAGQLRSTVPPEPPHNADLATLGAWIERWLPVVGVAAYETIGGTGDFFAHASDSVTSAVLQGCTLVLRERFVSTAGGQTSERRQAVRVPLEQLDTTAIQPRVSRAQLLLSKPDVLVRGQLVVPLRNPSRTRFITIQRDDTPDRDSLAFEHLIPIVFAHVPASRSARAIRRAAGECGLRRAPEPVSRLPDLGATATKPAGQGVNW